MATLDENNRRCTASQAGRYKSYFLAVLACNRIGDLKQDSTMEQIKPTTAIIFIIASLLSMTEASIEPRKMLHIPEKIIGGMMDIVQSHKNKPSQVSQQVQLQTYQGYPQQNAPWNTAYPVTAHSQNQFQNQIQNGNYGGYPTTSGQMYPTQNGYTGSQVQSQSQQQNFPQNQQGNQFQVQSQQSFGGQIHHAPFQLQSFPTQQVQFQGQNQQTVTGQFGVNQGQNQGQNQQSNQFGPHQGQLQNQGQILSGQVTGMNTQTGSLVNGNPSGHYGQFSGQNSQFQGQQQMGDGQSTGFQVSSQQPAGSGPTCVCQAWTKPQTKGSDGIGKSNETTEIPE